MTDPMELRLDAPRAIYGPGDEVTGVAAWDLPTAPKSVELRAVWVAESRAGEDVGVAESLPFPAPGTADRRAFRLRLPEGPPSFRGRLMRLTWTLELIAEPGGESCRLDVHISPTGAEIVLPALPDEKAEARPTKA
jgi:hypothetical protein